MVGTNIPRIIHDDARITTLTATTGTITTGTVTSLTSTTAGITTATIGTANITNATLTGDLTRRSAIFISGTAGAGQTAITQTAASWDYELPDEGLYFFDGTNGAMLGHLPATPVIGKEVTFVLQNSGATAATVASANISGNFLKSMSGVTPTLTYGIYLMWPYSYVTITNDGTYYYVTDTDWICPTEKTMDTEFSGARWL